MPEDCLKFRKIGNTTDYTNNDDQARQDELDLIGEMGDPFGDVFGELGMRKTGGGTSQTPNADGMDTSFVEGSTFDFF